MGRLDEPVDARVGVRAAHRRYGGQCVNQVAKRTETDNEEGRRHDD